MKPVILALLVAVVLGGCADSDESEILTVAVSKQVLSVEVPSKGEVVAAKSTKMSVPGGMRGSKTLAWLLPENSVVKKGDVIARFDGEDFILERDSTRLDLNAANLETDNKSLVIATEKADIKSDTKVVNREIEFSDQFNVDDLTVYSKNEIIDALDNREYLAAQLDFLNWKLDNFSHSSKSEMDLMMLKAAQYQTKLEQFETALTKLEVYAPHDGILIYESNWRGEKPRIGQTMWPGTNLARLPDLSELQATLHVLEGEAGNVEVGNDVKITLDAMPEQVFNGKVLKKAGISKPIKSGLPVKYFEITVSITDANGDVIKPGNKVSAVIIGQRSEPVLSVPLQAIFSDEQGSFVYAEVNGKLQKTPVSLGLKTFAQAEVVAGLEQGQKVALFKPMVM